MGYSVKDQSAIVSGANRGIGLQITEGLLTAGAKRVYLAVRDTDSVSELVEKYGERVLPVKFDLTKSDTIKQAAEVASDVTLVINNAGVLRTTSVLDADALESLDFEMDVNLYGFIRVAQAFVPVLKKNGGGALVQLNSVVSVKSFPQFATYSASKAASYSITQSLRSSLAEEGIAVLSVHPGPIATDMGDSAGLTDVAEPPSVVSEAILAALENGDFHVFPDSMAKQIESAYESFAANIVEAELSEG